MLEAVGAERAVLSILLKKPDSLFAFDIQLNEDDFTNSGNKLLFSLMSEIINDDPKVKLDNYLLISKAEEKGITDFFKLTQNGDLLDALQETGNNVSESSIGKYIAIVKKASIKRNLIDKLDHLKDDVEVHSGTAIDIQNMVESEILSSMEAIDTGDDEIVNLAEDFEEVINSYAEDEAVIGLDIGMPRWQDDCGGIANGTITGLFARAKEGKSQFAAYSAMKIAIHGDPNINKLPVLYLDTEMQARKQQMRLCSMMTGVPYKRIQKGYWRSDVEECKKVKKAFADIKGSPIYYKNISGKSVNYVLPIIRKFIYKHVGGKTEGNIPKCLVIYDYIKLMNPEDLKTAQEYQLLGFLLGALHDLCANLNFPMIVLGQLNREALKTDSIGSIAGSDRITHNVDSLTLFRKKKQDELEVDGSMRGTHLSKVLISRDGPGHDYDEWININFDKSRGSFIEDKRNSEVQMRIKDDSKAIRDRLGDQDTAEFGNIREK